MYILPSTYTYPVSGSATSRCILARSDVATKFRRFVVHFGPWCNQRAGRLRALYSTPNTSPITHKDTETHTHAHYITQSILANAEERKFN